MTVCDMSINLSSCHFAVISVLGSVHPRMEWSVPGFSVSAYRYVPLRPVCPMQVRPKLSLANLNTWLPQSHPPEQNG
jgi:hypothetical protein